VAGQDAERESTVAAAAAIGWTIRRETKRGYLVMHCGCGEHQEILHKTPSNPNHFTNKLRRITSTCVSR
jgi:hypothetical protein